MFMLTLLSSFFPPRRAFAKERILKSLRVSCGVFSSSPSHYTQFFFYIKFIHFFCMKFFSNIFFGTENRRLVLVLLSSVPDRARGEEPLACLLLWKIEKIYISFFSVRGGQHNIILTHFFPEKKVFSPARNFSLTTFFFRLSVY